MHALLTMALALTVSAPADAAPEIWMCHQSMDELAKHPDQWTFVREHISGIQVYIDQFTRYDAADMTALAELVREADLKVSVECGGLLDFGPVGPGIGAWTAEHELAKIDRYLQAGGVVHYLNMDGPVRRMMFPAEGRTPMTDLDAIAEELVDYMKRVRERIPGIEFFLLTNFPNWGWKGEPDYHGRGEDRMNWGDYEPVVRAMIRKTREAGMPLRAISCDNPFEYATGTRRSANLDDPTAIDWMARIANLEQIARDEGLEFNMIINSEVGGQTSAEAFHRETLRYLDRYLNSGAAPTRLYIQSWYPHPEAVVPDDAPHTMTNLVADVIRRPVRLER